VPIYKLTPRDPTDTVWEGSPFVETVWTDARNEHAARVRVSIVARAINLSPMRPMNDWPWIYSARCTIDETHAAISSGEVVTADGRPIVSTTRPRVGRSQQRALEGPPFPPEIGASRPSRFGEAFSGSASISDAEQKKFH
jgi:hypothetical protein